MNVVNICYELDCKDVCWELQSVVISWWKKKSCSKCQCSRVI